MSGPTTDADRLRQVLVAARDGLLRHVARRAGRVLLRYETPDDLVQGVQQEALRGVDAFEFRGEREARAWLLQVADRYLADRHNHWNAMKRRSGSLLRLDATRTASGAGELAISQTGPVTFASRREQLVLATRALGLLLERDRRLVEGQVRGLTVAEQARELGLTEAAAARARSRAIERFRKAYELLR